MSTETKANTMGLDESDENSNATIVVPAKDTDGVPYCRLHHCRMKAYSSGPKDSRKTYYKCPVNGCEATGIKVRDPKRMPSEPMACPRCAVRGKTVHCERDGDLKGREFKSGRPQKRPEFQIVLVCPECGWIASPMTDPRLDDMRPRREERYGER